MTELAHLRELVTDGIHKAPILQDGGILAATGPQFSQIFLGHDLDAGFVGVSALMYDFVVFEALALRILMPPSICLLK